MKVELPFTDVLGSGVREDGTVTVGFKDADGNEVTVLLPAHKGHNAGLSFIVAAEHALKAQGARPIVPVDQVGVGHSQDLHGEILVLTLFLAGGRGTLSFQLPAATARTLQGTIDEALQAAASNKPPRAQ